MAKAVGTTPKQLLPFAKVRASLPDSTPTRPRRTIHLQEFRVFVHCSASASLLWGIRRYR